MAAAPGIAAEQILFSQLVIDESSAGDAEAASERLEALRSVEPPETTVDVDSLATALTDAGAKHGQPIWVSVYDKRCIGTYMRDNE